MSTTHTYDPDFAIHPGESLLETLDAIGMTQKELAERTGRPLKTINEIVKGKAAITADTALQLERVLGVPATFWNNAQRNYEAQLSRIAETKNLQRDVAWLEKFPVAQLCKIGWVPKLTDSAEQLRAVLGFFGVTGVKEWCQVWQQTEVAFRKSQALQANLHSVAAWLRAGEREAQNIHTQPYNKLKFSAALHKIRSLTTAEPEDFVPQMKRLCAEAGVALVFVPEVTGTCAYGATRWLTPEKAILQLSLRGKADDFLWFTFFHEAAHILKHGKRSGFIESNLRNADPATQREETEADTYAADFLIPPRAYCALLALKPWTAIDIEHFAKQQGIAPGIVVGRLQHEKAIPYNHHNGLKRRFEFRTN